MTDAISILDIEIKNTAVEIIDPVSGEPMGLTVTLRPLSDAAVVKVQNRYAKDIRDALMRRKPTQAMEEERDVETLATAIVGWDWNDATIGGQPISPLAFTPENVRAVLRAKKLSFIRRQVDQKLGEEGDFFAV